MDRYYQLGPVTLCMRNWPKYPQWPFASWKLDAYTTEGDDFQILLEYDRHFSIAEGENWQVIESSALAKRMIQPATGDWLLWKQVQSDGTELKFAISGKESHIVLLQDTTLTFGMAAMEALNFFLFPMLLRHNILTFHSALLEHNGCGILIAAPSGVGKTTHARLWRDLKNALILNGDRSSCFRKNGRWFAFGSPWCGTGGEQINRKVPVKALILLRRGEQDEIVPLTPMEILNELLPLTSCEPGMQEKLLSLLDPFLNEIPVTALACTATPQAVQTLEAWLEALP